MPGVQTLVANQTQLDLREAVAAAAELQPIPAQAAQPQVCGASCPAWDLHVVALSSATNSFQLHINLLETWHLQGKPFSRQPRF